MAGPLMIPLLLGGFGPSIAGIIMTYRTQDREGRRDFWRRSISSRQIGARWYAVILLIFPAVYALAILLDMLLGGDLPGAEALVQSASQPAFLLVGVVMSLVMGPLSEEFGWRGFALDRLQVRWNALLSSLVLGAFWLCWHLPEFFMTGIPTGELVSGVLPFLIFATNVFAMSILYTWVFNNTGRSILSAILLHFMCNFALNGVSPLSERAQILVALLLVLAAVSVVFGWGSRTLTRQPQG
jgi:membrane protease YdiL (CAAX protease family)